MEDERLGPGVVHTDEGSECSVDSYKPVDNQSALTAVGEKLKKLHNGQQEHVSSDEDSVVEEQASTAKKETDDMDRDSVDSEEEDFKLHVDVDMSDQEGESCARDDSEVIELSAGEDDDCEVVEIKQKEETLGEESLVTARKENSVEVVDLDDSGELEDAQVEDNVGKQGDAMEQMLVEDEPVGEAASRGPADMEEDELGESEDVHEKSVGHDAVEMEAAVEGRLESSLETGLDDRESKSQDVGDQEELGQNDVNEDNFSDTEGHQSEQSDGVVRQESAETVIEPRTIATAASGDVSLEEDLSVPDDFFGFAPSPPHSFHKEFRHVDDMDGGFVGTLYVSAESHFFTTEIGDCPLPNSGSEAGDSSRLSPVPTENSRCNSPSVSSVGSERRSGRKKISLDVSNPLYMKPFDLGWKRELVYRSSLDSANRRMADVYYYTPTNKKVRSAREVLEHVDGVELTIKNFLFTKEPLGLDGSRETIRDAKKNLNIKETTSKEVREEEEIFPSTPKSSEKLKSPKIAEMAPIPIEPKSPLGQAANSSPPTLRKAAATPTPTRSFPRIKVTPTRNQKEIKVGQGKRPPPRPLLPKPREQELEMGMLPPLWSAKTAMPKKAAVSTTWSSTPKNKERSRKRSSPVDEGPPNKLISPGDQVLERIHSVQNFMHDVCAMYKVLQHVFEYLKVQELLRAARVCCLWRDLAQHPSLWATVHMKNSKVSDWQGLASTLSIRQTTHLDLRKMLLPQRADEVAHMWEQFSMVIGRVDCLERLDLCRCPAAVVQHVLTACPKLRTLNATAISCNSISLHDAGSLISLEELRLKSLSGITLETSLCVLSQLSNLKHLALTTFRNLGQQGVDVIGSLQSLELLELGEVNNLPASFPAQSLARLSNLRRLRLEKVQGLDVLTFNYLEVARALPQLTQLELVNFDVKPGFDNILASCSNIRKLLIIPTYVTQSATTNRMVLGGVLQLAESLQQFVWGVTHELLRVTELFVDQCDVDQVKKEQLKKGDCIPVLKPVPGIAAVNSPSDVWNCEEKYGGPTPSVEILSLPKLHKLLNLQLPNTKVKLLKIPFHATWRQYLSDMHT